MGLLDNVLGSDVPGGGVAKSLGMALLAYLGSRSGGSSTSGAAGGGGGLGSLIGGIMGGSAPSPQANAAASGGLGALLQRFQQNGYGDMINSWIGSGANQQIAPHQLHEALGPETVEDLSQHTGVPRHEVLSQLSQALPTMIDRLTPQGRIPDEDEMAGRQSAGPIET